MYLKSYCQTFKFILGHKLNNTFQIIFVKKMLNADLQISHSNQSNQSMERLNIWGVVWSVVWSVICHV